MSEMKLTDIKKYTEAIQWRDWDTCEIIAEEHKTLIDRIKELEQKLAEAEEHMKFQADVMCDMGEVVLENKKLEEKLRIAAAALEFYADWKSYKQSRHDVIEDYFGELIEDWSVVEYIEADGDKFKSAFNGKRAREALAKINHK